MPQQVHHISWIDRRLARKFAAGLVGLLTLLSVLFLALAMTTYQRKVVDVRNSVLSQVNGLLRVSLENAMLKRDLDGLRTIIRRFGEQDGVVATMIINPAGEVRFAANPEDLGQRFSFSELDDCYFCLTDSSRTESTSTLVTNPDGVEVLRNIVPVQNREICRDCHGAAKNNPINGLFVVDYESGQVRREALASVAFLSVSGIVILVVCALGMGAIVRWSIISPLSRLSQASSALAAGDLDARVLVQGEDEIADLGRDFNQMADRLKASFVTLEEREAFLQRVIDVLPDGIRVIGTDYRLRIANRAYLIQTGLEASRIEDAFCYSALGRKEPCVPTMETCPLFALKDNQEGIKFVQSHKDSEGLERKVEITAAMTDITYDGQSEKVCIEAIRDLNQEVRMSQEQRLAEMGQLASGVAHEIYNPLAAVKLGIGSILSKRKAGQEIPSDHRDYLTLVDREIDVCIQITRRLLSLSQVPSRHNQLLSLTQIVPEVLSLLNYEAMRLGLAIVVDLRDAPLNILATDAEIRMLVLNLCQNAFHAMNDGGKLTVSGSEIDGWVVLEFSDTGVGIAPDVIPRIFDPFFSQRADQHQGTGLGLTISKNTVKRFHGKMDVTSEIGVGTTFVVQFPLPKNRVTT